MNRISVSELSKLLGVSRQAVYKRLTGDLQPYVNEVDGKKWLDIAVLEYLNLQEVDNQKTIKVDEVVSVLTKELDIKNKQIEQLQEQIKQLTSSLDNVTASLMAAQALHANQVKQLEAGSNVDIEEPIKKHWWQRKKKIKAKE